MALRGRRRPWCPTDILVGAIASRRAGSGGGPPGLKDSQASAVLSCPDSAPWRREGRMSICLRRRDFIAGLGGAAALPLAARAQPGDRVRRIGVLMPYDENDPEWKTRFSAFTQALADLGWADGRNL